MKPIVLRTILVFTGFCCMTPSDAQSGEWAWMSGNNTTDATGTYGTKGTAASGNKPGDRDSHSGWMDASGNFWIFGGENQSNNDYNDLWEYNPGTGWWTWVSGSSSLNATAVYGTKGTPAAANQPGARFGQVGWTDPSGNFWIFGGEGYTVSSQGYLNDLWKFTPSTATTGVWTWVSGNSSTNATGVYGTKGTPAAGNAPGARYYASGWADASGNVWIFGGRDQNKNVYNDLWKYSTVSNQWTWVSGSSTPNSGGLYGTEGTGTTATLPPARFGQTISIDASGNVWLFGGSDNNNNCFNDVWKYSGGQWTWVGGSSATNAPGVYGTKGVAAAGNRPGGRIGAIGTIDPFGNFWIFGGNGYDVNGNGDMLNDLWMFSTTTDQWAWVSGANTIDQAATYGTKGSAAAANVPNARNDAAGWADASGNIWVIGGFDQNGGDYNDLWEFSTPFSLALTAVTLEGIAVGNGNSLTWQTINEINTASFIVERGTDGVTFADIGSVPAAGSGNNRYFFIDANPPKGGNIYYRLKIMDTYGNISYSSTIVLAGSGGNGIQVYPNPTTGGITVRLGSIALVNTPARLFDMNGRLIREQMITGQELYMNLNNVPAGIYLLQLKDRTTIRIIKG